MTFELIVILLLRKYNKVQTFIDSRSKVRFLRVGDTEVIEIDNHQLLLSNKKMHTIANFDLAKKILKLEFKK